MKLHVLNRLGALLDGAWRGRCARAGIVAVTVCMVGCSKETPPPKPAPPPSSAEKIAQPAIANATDPRWITQANPRNKVAVVFIHGIFGDTLGTWSLGDGKPTFFQVLGAVPDVGTKLDMFAFGFTSNMFGGGSLDVREAANKLHESLKFAKVLDYQTIVFVAHSMGGLITLRELINHNEILEKVPLVVLYATPQEGAQIANVANVVMKNPALGEMFNANNNAYLQSLDDDWKRLRERPIRPRVTCGYEKAETFGVMIVPWSSATRFCDGSAIAIEGADHISIVKPDRQNHPSVVLLVNALNEYVLGGNLVTKLETPDFVQEGDRTVYNLGDPVGRGTARLVNAGRTTIRYTLAEIDRYLHLWPDDTPRSIAGGQRESVHMGLAVGATAPEYQFTLLSDVGDHRRIVVRVDVVAMKRLQQQVAESVSKEVTAFLADPRNASDFATAGPDGKADEELVSAVAGVIAKESPNLPVHARLILSADYLSALNLSRPAATALRRAETIAPASAKSSSVQWLGGIVAAQSGTQKVFAQAGTPTIAKDELVRSKALVRGTELARAPSTEAFAQALKKVPAFKADGYMLEGDILVANGKPEDARAKYVAAASLQRTPSLDFRLQAMGETAPSGSVKAIERPFERFEASKDKAAVIPAEKQTIEMKTVPK